VDLTRQLSNLEALEKLTEAVAVVGTNSVDVAAHMGLPKRKTALA